MFILKEKLISFYLKDVQVIKYETNKIFDPSTYGQYYLTDSFSSLDIISCFVQCSTNSTCGLLTFINNTCGLYRKHAIKVLTKASQSNLFIKMSNGLIFYLKISLTKVHYKKLPH